MFISIIVCTCNRAAGLRRTLECLDTLQLRPEWKVEVIVVDNASTDDTAAVAKSARLRNLTVAYVFEPRKGQSNARNAGLLHSTADIILFTDDDVVPAEGWAEQMVAALESGRCEAVTGRVTLAPELMRPWLTPMQRWWLACSDDAKPHDGVRELIGANMGFRREVLRKVPAFDPELGPGALGFADDTLFSWQLARAGCRIEYAPAASIVHHLDASRLRRRYWLKDAAKRGRTAAYVRYHWEHSEIRNPRFRQLKNWLKLQVRKTLQPPASLDTEGCNQWETGYVFEIEMCRQFLLEQRRPRNYSRFGLVKLDLLPTREAARSALAAAL